MSLLRFTMGLMCLAGLQGCISTATIDQQQRPTHWASSMNQANNLYQVTPTLYRSEQPLIADIKQLDDLNIKTVVNLRTRHQDAIELANTSIRLVHIPIKTWAISDQHIADALWSIQQGQQQGGVLLHCYHGSDRTGLTIAMYRIIYQDWPIADAKQEMKHGGYGFHPIWKNIEAFFQPHRVDNIKRLISQKEQPQRA